MDLYKNVYEAFANCDREELAKQVLNIFADKDFDDMRSMQMSEARHIVDRAYNRMEKLAVKDGEEQDHIIVYKTFDESEYEAVCINHKEYSDWKEKNTVRIDASTLNLAELEAMDTDAIFELSKGMTLPTRYAFEFTAWDEILGWKLEDASIKAYGLAVCLAYILWEMTFIGIEDETREKVMNDLLDAKNEADKIINGEAEVKAHVNFEDFVKEIMGDDYTEDWYPEEEQERDMKAMAISSYRANKEFERILLVGRTV